MRAVVVSTGDAAAVSRGLASLGWEVDRCGSEGLTTKAGTTADLLAIDMAWIVATGDRRLLARVRRLCPHTGVFVYGDDLSPACEAALSEAPDIPVIRTGASPQLLGLVVACACDLPPA